MKKVLFLHGLESTPGGTKPTFLKKEGYEVINPALPKEPFSIAVKIAQDAVNHFKPDIIVGSSRGGAVAMAIDGKGAELILIAPAWKRYGVFKDLSRASILHCESDSVIPFEDTQELFRNNVGVNVISCGKDHRMSDEHALKALKEVIDESWRFSLRHRST